MTHVSFDNFAALQIVLGTIKSVETIPNTDKLLRLEVDIGEAEHRQVVSGIREFYPDPQVLVEKQCPFVVNLESRTIRGFESQAMILAAHADTVGFTLLQPEEQFPPGTPVK
jgi:methionine--tRNA ligase beta chain